MKVTPVFSSEDQDLIDPRWTVTGSNLKKKLFHARRTIRHPNPPPRQKCEFAHRIVMERMLGRKLQWREYVDHINHDQLDNRRTNLRVVDSSGNGQNRKPYPTRGTTFHKQLGKWQAQTQLRGKSYYIGIFNTREQAAEAAENKRKELNFLGESI
jgi:hypothetical protein